jgi:hypothetical protein
MNYLPAIRLLATAGLLLLSACQTVIDLELQDATPRLTIEGQLTDDGQPATVQLIRSVPYTTASSFPAVRGALLTLRDNAGGLDTLRETTTPGQYRGQTLRGQVGRQYTLRVEVDGQAYSATSTLLPAVPLTGLQVRPSGFGDELELLPAYQDPAGVPNYYVFRLYRNGRLTQGIFAQSDQLTDGQPNSRALNVQGPSPVEDELVPGDSVRVAMQHVDVGVYEYFRTLNMLLQVGLASASPANPTSNFSGGVLGYFSTYAQQQRRFTIPR